MQSRAPDDLNDPAHSSAPASAPAILHAAPRTYGEGVVALTRLRALDGIRGVFVTAVVLGHLGFLLSARPDSTQIFNAAGFIVGVDVFFVLSGALITSLLLMEFETTSTISLRQFYIRRFRRLAPAFFIAIVAGLCISALSITPGMGKHPGAS